MDGKQILSSLRKTFDFYGPNPPPNEVSEQLGIPKEEADTLWQEFLTSEYGRLAKTEVTKGGSVETPAPPRVKRKYVRKAKPMAVEEPKREEPKKHLHDLSLDAIKAIATLGAITIAIRMVGYLVEYFSLWETDPILSWTTALALAFILFVSLQVVVMSMRAGQKILLVTSALLFAVVAFIDISGTATIIGHKKQAVVALQRSESSSVLEAKALIPGLEASVTSFETTKKTLEAERAQLLDNQVKLDRGDSKYDSKYATSQYYLRLNKKAIDENQVKLDTDKTKLEQYRKTPGLYSTAVAEMSDGTASFLDWAVAVGLGLVGPWALSVTLFLRGKDEKTNGDKAN